MSQKHVKLVGTVTVGPKGQVVIPVEAREKMEIIPGDKLIALYIPDKKAISFVAESQIQTIIDQMGSHIGNIRSHLNEI